MILTLTIRRCVTNTWMVLDRVTYGIFSAQIHWHGLHQRGTPYSDGFPTQSQCAVPAKRNMKYNFVADPPGTTFWHAHFHSMNADGLYGPFIVEDEPGSFPFDYDEERVILMTDEYGSTSWELEDYLASPDPNGNPHPDPAPTAGVLCLYDEKNKTAVTTSCSRGSSGQGFNLNFEPGKVYRLRIISGSIIAPFIFSIDQHELQLVSADYSTLDGTTRVNGVPITVGSGHASHPLSLTLSNPDWSTIRSHRQGQDHRPARRNLLG